MDEHTDEYRKTLCGLCNDTKPFCFSYGCQHFYCLKCLTKEMTSAIDNDQFIKIKCPNEQCSVVPKDSMIKEFVTKKYFDQYLKLKIKSQTQADFSMFITRNSSPAKLSKCQICLEKFSDNKLEHIGCRHKYCRPCLVKYLEKVYDLDPDDLPCPSPNCSQMIPGRMAKKLLSSDSVDTNEVEHSHHDIVDFPIELAATASFPLENCSMIIPSTQSQRISDDSRDTSSIEQDKLILTNKEAKIKCEICLDYYVKSQMSSFGCEHQFCRDCLVCHIKTKIETGEVFIIICPQADCDVLTPDQFIRDNVPLDYQVRYDRLLLKKGVEQFDDVLYCPKCSSIVECDLTTCNGICDNCGFVFCTSCLKEFHGFTDCDTVEQHNQEQAQSLSMIQKNCKKCPGCNSDIEKDEIGCNHMTCTICKTEFCWKCMEKLPDQSNKAEFERHFSRCQLFDFELED